MQLNKCCWKLLLIFEFIIFLIIILLLIFSINDENFKFIISIMCYVVIVNIILIYKIKEKLDTNKKEDKEFKLNENEDNILKDNKVIVNSFSTVSHELRTPLTSIVGFSKLIKKRLNEIAKIYLDKDVLEIHFSKEDNYHTKYKKFTKSMKKIEENIDIIISEGDRLTSIINNFLDFSKLESGYVELHKENVDIQEITSKAMLMFYSLVQAKNIYLSDEVEEDLPEIYCDKDKIFQVILNLIANSIKFTEEGFIYCRVKKYDENYIIVEVEDSGIGIDKEHHEKIFESFTQIKNNSFGSNGTGLGLAICKRIIEAHKGTIWVESDEGEGSKFFFKIPIN